MINRYYSDSWDDRDEDLKQAIQVFCKNQADAWRIQWGTLNSSGSQADLPSQSTTVFYSQPEKRAAGSNSRSVLTRHTSNSWDKYDEDLKQSLRERLSSQAAFRHCLWEMMASDESKGSCFFDCCCEASGYRITEKKAA